MKHTAVFNGGAITAPILFPLGTAAAPSISFVGQSDLGFFQPAAGITNAIDFVAAGNPSIRLRTTQLQVGSAVVICWSSTGNIGTANIGLSISSGVLSIGTGAAGDASGRLQGAYFRTIARTVAQLATAAGVGSGTRGMVSDATVTMTAGIGTVVVGGGTNFVPVYSDGTSWLIG